MRIGCYTSIKKVTKKLRICNTAFPQQQWLQERASMLSYTTLVLLFCIKACDTMVVSVIKGIFKANRVVSFIIRQFKDAQTNTAVSSRSCSNSNDEV